MYHSPVLLAASVSGLNIHPASVYVDATFGGGGHSQEILNNMHNAMP
jgi:16S rRNA (cytosine1402-N4)-methyltransferase